VLMCENLDQAYERSGLIEGQGNKGYEAAVAALNLAIEYKNL